MRVLAIGLGAAGSRIVDHLYNHDKRSKVGCMSAIAIDTDAETLLSLRYLPDYAKIHFPSIDPNQHFDACSTIDIEEIMTDIQKMETVQLDAIMVFCGTGGSMVDVVSVLVPELRKSFIEPIFAVVTLPCREEGKIPSAKAADDLDLLVSFMDAIILFDNETWYRKLQDSVSIQKDGESVSSVPLPWGALIEGPHDIYYHLNERIARKIGLLLRAGEFNEEGLEVSEVVLDAGEVLNTLKAKGFVAVGYAAEQIPKNWLEFFERWRSARHFIEGSQERAARIVALAKRAVYEDISVPCDLTSADKALILIAGPSKELSMKGFQTVRKWIDRSIAGLEMRSGDYPVKNTQYVGIIIMLAGIQNIPRVNELQQIREGYRLDLEQQREEERKKAGRWLIEGVQSAVSESQESSFFIDSSEVFSDESFVPHPTDTISLYAKKPDAKRHEEIITLIPRQAKRKEKDTIILPARSTRIVSDLTGKAEGGARQAPKDTTLGVREIRAGRHPIPRENDRSNPIVRTMPKARDGSIDGDSVIILPSWQRIREGIIDAETVFITAPGKRMKEFLDSRLKVGTRTVKTRDNIYPGAERKLESSKIRPKELDPAKKKISIVDQGTKKPRKKKKEESDEDDIVWIT